MADDSEDRRLPERLLVARYQACVHRILNLFPGDPLPASCAAQSLIERLEALLDRNLLAPRVLRLRSIPCSPCVGTGRVREGGIERKCTRCGGTGEIA